MPTQAPTSHAGSGLPLVGGPKVNLTIRLFGRELLAVSAWIDEAPDPEPEQPAFSIGFAAGEIATDY